MFVLLNINTIFCRKNEPRIESSENDNIFTRSSETMDGKATQKDGGEYDGGSGAVSGPNPGAGGSCGNSKAIRGAIIKM